MGWGGAQVKRARKRAGKEGGEGGEEAEDEEEEDDDDELDDDEVCVRARERAGVRSRLYV